MLVLAMFLGTQIFGAVIFNPTVDVLYWYAVGMLFAVHRYAARDAQLVRNPRLAPGDRLPVEVRGGRIRTL